MVTFESMVELAGKSAPPILSMWRDMIRHEIRHELSKNYSLTQAKYEDTLKRAALHIEQYGCSVPKAVDRILNPDDFIGMKEHA
jgi:hypothetical protein